MTQREPTLAEAMYPSLTKAKEDAKANEAVKAQSKKLLADLRELRAEMKRARERQG
jgi:DNA-directed RNA polymerase subunit L